MNLIRPLNLLVLFLLPLTLISQEDEKFCGTDEYYQDQLDKNPELQKLEQASNDFAEDYQPPMTKNGQKYIIPVVFHVMHTYGPENVDKEKILANFQTLNEDYQKQNSDTQFVRNQFKSLIADHNIEFRLARLDPQGNCTDGIERHYSENTNSANDNVKGEVQWDPNRYLNVWIVGTINRGGRTNIGGYANFPWDKPYKDNDGIVMIARSVDGGDRTLTHEVGHYLGLYHPFQGGCKQWNINSNDEVDDTPMAQNRDEIISSCDGRNTCGLDFPQGQDKPDMLDNFMDYTPCGRMFTKGQKTRSLSYLNPNNANNRAQMVSQSNLAYTGVLDTIQNKKPLAYFDTEEKEICSGDSTQFEQFTCQGIPDSFKWYFQGGEPNVSTKANPQVLYKDTGSYKVTLVVANENGKDSITLKNHVNVIQGKPVSSNPFQANLDSGNLKAKGWRFEQTFPGDTGWQLSSKASSTGTQSLYLNNYNLDRENSTYSVITPKLNLYEPQRIKLTFNYAYASLSNSSTDKMTIEVSNDCGATWKSVANMFNLILKTTDNPVSEDFVPTPNQWEQQVVNFNTVDSGQIFLRFNFITGKGNNIYMDNIRFGYPVGMAERDDQQGQLRLYPNPVQGKLNLSISNVSTGNAQLTLRNMVGQELSRQNVQLNTSTENNFRFNVENLNIQDAGVYFLMLETEDSRIVKKFNYVK